MVSKPLVPGKSDVVMGNGYLFEFRVSVTPKEVESVEIFQSHTVLLSFT